MEFRTRTTIHASPAAVWEILTTAGAYPLWNPTVVRVEGTIAAGEKIKVFATISPDRAFPVKVSVFDAPQKMVWRGGMPIPGLFVGERVFELRPVAGPDGAPAVDFEMSETFRGLLLPMFRKQIPDLQPTFDEFASSLKQRAEGGV